jgi:CRISPR/Cas system-associated exonuclease Cas4 (RecB family)
MDLFLMNEVRRFGEGFHVLAEKLEERVTSSMSLGDIPVRFFGFPDRIDEKNGKHYVLDYKSKAPARKFWTIGSEFREFQLPLYALMLSNRDYEKIGGIGYYDLTKKLDIVFVAGDDDVVDYLRKFEKEMLMPTLKDLLDPKVDFSQTDDPDACRYCSFVQVCGIKNV